MFLFRLIYKSWLIPIALKIDCILHKNTLSLNQTQLMNRKKKERLQWICDLLWLFRSIYTFNMWFKISSLFWYLRTNNRYILSIHSYKGSCSTFSQRSIICQRLMYIFQERIRITSPSKELTVYLFLQILHLLMQLLAQRNKKSKREIIRK